MFLMSCTAMAMEKNREEECFTHIQNADETSKDSLCISSATYAASIGHCTPEFVKRIDSLLKEGEQLVHIAAYYDNCMLLRHLKNINVSIFAPDMKGRTAFHYAARGNATAALKLLRGWRANIDYQDAYGRTALHYAARENAVEAVKLLLQWKATVDAHDFFIAHRATPFFYAAKANALDAMKLLMVAGARFITYADGCDDDDDERLINVLHYATQGDAVDAMRLIKQWGFDCDGADCDGLKPLHHAVESKAIKALSLLKEWKVEVGERDFSGWTPLHFAACQRDPDLDILRFLIQWGAGANAMTNENETPLHLAAEASQNHWQITLDVMTILKEAGASINAQNSKGETCLHYAAKADSLEIIQALVGWQADIHIKDEQGKTAFHDAARCNGKEAVELLKHSGADVHAEDNRGRTAMHHAAEKNAVAVMKQLKGYGVNPQAPDTKGATPVHWAAYGDASDALQLLLTWLRQYAEKIELEPVNPPLEEDEVLSWKMLLNLPDNDGRSAVHYAASGNAVKALKLLAEWQADICSLDKNGRSALHTGAENNAVEALYLLKEMGVPLNARDKWLRTAKDSALTGRGCNSLMALYDLGNIRCMGLTNNHTLLCWEVIMAMQKEGQDRSTLLHRAVDGEFNILVKKLLLDPAICVNQKDYKGDTVLHKAAKKTFGSDCFTKNSHILTLLLLHPALDIHAKNNKGETAFQVGTKWARLLLDEWRNKIHGTIVLRRLLPRLPGDLRRYILSKLTQETWLPNYLHIKIPANESAASNKLESLPETD